MAKMDDMNRRILRELTRDGRISNLILAERVGLTPLTVGHVLSGKSAVRATNLMALADELDLALVLLPKAVAERLAREPPMLPMGVRATATRQGSLGERGRCMNLSLNGEGELQR